MFLCSIIQTPLLGRQRGSSTSNSQAVQIQQDTDIAVFFSSFVYLSVCILACLRGSGLECHHSGRTTSALSLIIPVFFFSLDRKSVV